MDIRGIDDKVKVRSRREKYSNNRTYNNRACIKKQERLRHQSLKSSLTELICLVFKNVMSRLI